MHLWEELGMVTPEELIHIRERDARASGADLFRDRHLLLEEVDRLLESEDVSDKLRQKMASLLTETANGLKGDPGPLVLHDWSDLPAIAAEIGKLADTPCEVRDYPDTCLTHPKAGVPACWPCHLKRVLISYRSGRE